MHARPGGLLVCAAILAACLSALPRAARADADTASGSSAPDAGVPEQYRLANAIALPGPPVPAALGSLGYGLDSYARYGRPQLAGAQDASAATNERQRGALAYAWSGQEQNWGLKFGMSTLVDPLSGWQRFAAPSFDRLHASSLPAMHVSGESRLADRWMVSLSADGLHTARGQGLDMDLRVDYSLTRDLQFFGSYRVTDSGGDGFELYGFVPANSARLGVRLRF